MEIRGENIFINILRKINNHKITINELKSILLKFYFIFHSSLYSSKQINKETSLIELINLSQDDKLILISLEKFAVLKKEFPFSVFEQIENIVKTQSEIEILQLIQEKARLTGQYFTNKHLVKRVYKLLDFFNKSSTKTRTVIDISSGIGDFLYPAFEDPSTIPFSVELDPIIFEFQVFKLFFTLQDYRKRKLLPLITINGDSIFGYNEILIKQMLEKKDTSFLKLLSELREKRQEAIFSKKELSFQIIKECLEKRIELSKRYPSLSNFNFYIYFPEIFFNESLKLQKNSFDFVIGNPPWIEHKRINYKYKEFMRREPYKSKIFGKYNFALPFLIIAENLSKDKVGLVLPFGILTDSYGKKWRKHLRDCRYNVEIYADLDHSFDNVSNEFFMLIMHFKNKCDYIKFCKEKEKHELRINHNFIFPPLFLLSNFCPENQCEIRSLLEIFPKLREYAFIRRGLTITKKYNETYNKENKYSNEIKSVEIVRHNIFSKNYKEGVINFEVFPGKEKIVYDKKVLGAPGDFQIFEKPKIVRRNRGKKHFIGLDLKGYYVNDIFDIIIPDEYIDLYGLFGYLSSSFVQFLVENFIVRDITSNLFRELPIPYPSSDIWVKMKIITEKWVKSNKDFIQAKIFRNSIDKEVFDYFRLSQKLTKKCFEKTSLYWIE
ncbi:MAG: Eco57I restriction-modification methylase domain-containing protein [Candidatus Heimdallarchaeum endolithica]|uniref:site-specific DNA-methyltransferase (adenine-specific) n=1 Tax=Candidatus Heimdallarchaeum endolithica TaxID=2876572 RepID=A0A9Y1BRN4_9ARCH|nr:MAG: Eco57I restriction-modification methylase domain-containing protein [Candidatus Heimdallarchaeum endolithica]